jgi:hypothetical protein
MSSSLRAQGKPKILLVFGYHRSGWIEAFERLKEQFSFVYIFHIAPFDGEVRCTDCPILYWQDFESADQLLMQVAPTAVVFMALTSGYLISLNIACKRKGIFTYVFQHGYFAEYKSYRLHEKLDRQQRARSPSRSVMPQGRSVRRSLTFLAKSILWKDVLITPSLSLYFLLQRLQGTHFACRWTPFRWRKPDRYICYTRNSASLYVEEDGAREEDLLIIGMPETDKFFAPHPEPQCAEKYYLMIDQPFADDAYAQTGIGRQTVVAFYEKLNAFCIQKGRRLKVKLHPDSYGRDWLPQHPNIDWFRDTDVAALVLCAEACFGTESTLLMPIIFLKKTCLFRIPHPFPASRIQDDLERRGVVLLLEFDTFKPEEINFDAFCRDSGALADYARDYLYRADGRSTERLARVLASATQNA